MIFMKFILLGFLGNALAGSKNSSEDPFKVIGTTSAQNWIDAGHKISQDSFYVVALAISHKGVETGNYYVPGKVNFGNALLIGESKIVPKYGKDMKVKYFAKHYLVQAKGFELSATVESINQLEKKCVQTQSDCSETAAEAGFLSKFKAENLEYTYNFNEHHLSKHSQSLTVFKKDHKGKLWPMNEPLPRGHFANPKYAQKRAKGKLGEETFVFKAPIAAKKASDTNYNWKEKYCEGQAHGAKQFSMVVDGTHMTEKTFNKKFKGEIEFQSVCDTSPDDNALTDKVMFTAATLTFKKKFWTKQHALGDGPMSFEVHDVSKRFSNGALIGVGDRPMAPWAAFLIVIGICFGFAGAVLAILYYLGDIGGREMVYAENEEFEMHWIRRMLFPVYGFELAKFLPLTYLFFLGIFVNATFKNIKESMLTEDLKELESLGMVMTNWVKLVLVLGAAFAVSALLLSLSNKFKLPNLAIGITAVFAIYFTINGFLLFTFRETLTNKASSIAWLKKTFSKGTIGDRFGQAFVAMFIFWPGSLNYVVSELWSAVGMGFVIWGSVNAIHSGHSATRYYSILPALGQIGQALAARTIDQIYAGTTDKFWSLEVSVYWIHACILVILACFGGCIWFIDRIIMNLDKYKMPEQKKKSDGKKAEKPGTCSSLAFVFRNPHSLTILGIIFCQAAFEVMEQLSYKDAAKISFRNDNAQYTQLRAREQFFVAIFALIFMLFIGSNMLRNFGWRITAFVTPTFVAVIGMIFYITLISGGTYSHGLYFDTLEKTKFGLFKLPKLDTVVMLGFWMNVLMPALKYSLFDATREIAYLSLTKEQRLRVKAVADIIGQRGGKSFAALLNVGFTSYKGIEMPYVCTAFGVFIVEVIIWFTSVFFLDKHIKKADETRNQEQEGTI